MEFTKSILITSDGPTRPITSALPRLITGRKAKEYRLGGLQCLPPTNNKPAPARHPDLTSQLRAIVSWNSTRLRQLLGIRYSCITCRNTTKIRIFTKYTNKIHARDG